LLYLLAKTFSEPPNFWLFVGFSLLCAACIFLWVARLPTKAPESSPHLWGMTNMSWVDMGLLLSLCFLGVFILQMGLARLKDAAQFGDIEHTILATFTMQGALIGIVLYLRKKLPGLYGTPFNRANAQSVQPAVLYSFFTFIKFLPLIWGATVVAQGILIALGVEINQQQPVKLLLQTLEDEPLKFLAITFGAVVLAPIAEEILFRGFLYRFFQTKMRTGFACMLNAGLFAAIHFNVASFVPLLILGILFTRCYQSTGSLAAPIAFHAMFNGFNILLILLSPWMPTEMQ
jgi:membrane protease YdiL (CAAX protease family)